MTTWNAGWKGPMEWPNVLGERVAPFSSLWLTKQHKSYPMKRRQHLPRVVASPMFYGKPRYDFVCIKPDFDDGAHNLQSNVCKLNLDVCR